VGGGKVSLSTNAVSFKRGVGLQNHREKAHYPGRLRHRPSEWGNWHTGWAQRKAIKEKSTIPERNEPNKQSPLPDEKDSRKGRKFGEREVSGLLRDRGPTKSGGEDSLVLKTLYATKR